MFVNVFVKKSIVFSQPFAVNVFVESTQVTKSQPISVILMRGAASLSTVLPRFQTLGGVSKEYAFLAETLCEDYGIVIIHSYSAGVSYSKGNDFNPEDNANDGTYHFWNLSLAQLFVILPVAMIVISIKYAYSVLVTDTDTCNFNFECAISLGPFHAFNNMASASSIAVAAIMNVIFSLWTKRFRRFFPLNSCIFLTGVLWTLMNICPQKHTFHLFTMSMVMTVLEAKFLLFGLRVGRTLMHYRFTGSFMAISMFWVILDTNFETPGWNLVFCAFTVATNACYAIYFAFSQGNAFFKKCFRIIRLIITCRYHSYKQNPKNALYEDNTQDESKARILMILPLNSLTVPGYYLLKVTLMCLLLDQVRLQEQLSSLPLQTKIC
uniref:TPT domain-containing protein n=1 Tax=Caenorhabditis tropicalis TaxID=1561998 RepID=A0A1I7U031_9PELO